MASKILMPGLIAVLAVACGPQAEQVDLDKVDKASEELGLLVAKLLPGGTKALLVAGA